MPRFVASDLVLHYLPMAHKKVRLASYGLLNMGQICSASENFQND